MRNRFVSDYVLKSTGFVRTPKQVGSRIQQMQVTCKSDRMLITESYCMLLLMMNCSAEAHTSPVLYY